MRTQDGHTVHTALTSDPGLWARVRDENVSRAVRSVLAAAHVLRLPAVTIRPVLDDRRRIRDAERKQPVLIIIN